jgi:DNA polymerase III gamma/tau subunit
MSKITSLDTALATGNDKLLRENVARIVASQMRGRVRSLVEATIEHTFEEVQDVIKRLNGAYFTTTIRNIARKFSNAEHWDHKPTRTYSGWDLNRMVDRLHFSNFATP